MLTYLAFKILKKTVLYRWITAKMKMGNLSISSDDIDESASVNVGKLTDDEDLLADTNFFRRAEDGNRYRSFLHHDTDNGNGEHGSKTHTTLLTLVGVADHGELSTGSPILNSS